jgi:hypothetical protein
MKAMYSVYDRTGDCFDFCDDEETEHSLTMTQSMTGFVFGSGAQNVSHVEKIIN